MLLLLALACTGDTPEAVCPGWSDPVAAGAVQNGELDELSGLAASSAYDSVLWAHNDQGDGARVFALNTTGADRGVYVLSGVLTEDWEDMAIGPGPDGGDWLYLGDIGDNTLSREAVALVRFPEPDPGSGGGTLVDAEVYALRYPDGPRDAETLLVDPLTGDVYVLTRAGGAATEVFRVAAEALADGVTMEPVATLALGGGGSELRGGSVSPNGRSVWLRTEDHVFLLSRSEDESLHEALTGSTCVAPTPEEVNGEAIAADNRGFFTAAEGEAATIWRVTN